jgi:hypothetical protein
MPIDVDLSSPNSVTASIAAAPDTTTQIFCSGAGIVTIDLSGTFTGLSGQIEVSLDGTLWRAADTFMVWEQTQNTAAVSFNVIGTARKYMVATYGVRAVRVNVTAIATGTAVFTMTTDIGPSSPMFAFNQNITVITSASRTSSNQSADQSNYFNTGAYIVIDVTNAGTGSITVALEGKDALSGKYFTILTSAAIVANSTTALMVYPGATPAANSVAASFLPRSWRINVTHNNANAITYSIGASTN